MVTICLLRDLDILLEKVKPENYLTGGVITRRSAVQMAASKCTNDTVSSWDTAMVSSYQSMTQSPSWGREYSVFDSFHTLQFDFLVKIFSSHSGK